MEKVRVFDSCDHNKQLKEFLKISHTRWTDVYQTTQKKIKQKNKKPNKKNQTKNKPKAYK